MGLKGLSVQKKSTWRIEKNRLTYFLSLTDINRKRDFVLKLMDEVKPKYLYKKRT